MFEKYVPDDHHGSPIKYIREVYLENGHEDTIIHRGRLSQLGGKYYCYRDALDNHHNALAATTIANEIDYSLVDAEPEEDEEESNVTPREAALRRWYSRKRGILLHHYALHDDSDVTSQHAHQLLKNAPGDATHEDVHRAIGDWQHSPRSSPPEQDDIIRESEQALAEYAKGEAEAAARNWNIITDELDITLVADEAKVLGETPDGHPYGGEIDRLAGVKDGIIPRGVYVFDVKFASCVGRRHLVQAESYRRTLRDDIPDVQAAVIRLGVEEGDWEIVTTHNDDWDSDELWDMFCRRAKSLYEDNLYDLALANSGR